MPKIIPVENIEVITNKVTEINSNVTDEQYPSALAVKKALDSKSDSGSASSSVTFGTEEDNLKTLSEHSALFGSDITAGVKGLKIVSTLVNSDKKTLDIEVSDAIEDSIKTAQDYYGNPTNARASLVLNHHSFEQYKVTEINGNTIKLRLIDETKNIIDSYVELHKDNVTRNYMWLYTIGVDDKFDVSINERCPIRPEVDYTYALGDDILLVGRNSFSEGCGNQNMGWYAATIGRDNIAYYAGFAIGAENKALGTYSLAFNQHTEATATASTSKGYLTKATANYSEAGGQQTEANHKASFTHGLGTKSGRHHQAVVGEYNNESETALFIVGNGDGGQVETVTQEYVYLDLQKINLGYTNIVPGSFFTTSDYFPLKDDGEGHVGYNSNNDSSNFIIIGDINYSTGVVYLTNAPMFAGQINQSTTFKYYLGDNGIIRSNAFVVEKNGSASIKYQGTTDNSVVIKKTLNDNIASAKTSVKSDIKKDIDRIDSTLVKTTRLTDTAGNYLIAEDETLSADNVEKVSDTDYNLDNIDSGYKELVTTTTNFADSYKDYSYSFDVTITQINDKITNVAQAPRFFVANINGIDISLQLRKGTAFLWGCEQLPTDKFIFSNIGGYLNESAQTNFHQAKLEGFKPALNTKYTVNFEVTTKELVLTINDREFKVTANEPYELKPKFNIGVQYAKCIVNNRVLYSLNNKVKPAVDKVDKSIKFITEGNNYALFEKLTYVNQALPATISDNSISITDAEKLVATPGAIVSNNAMSKYYIDGMDVELIETITGLSTNTGYGGSKGPTVGLLKFFIGNVEYRLCVQLRDGKSIYCYIGKGSTYGTSGFSAFEIKDVLSNSIGSINKVNVKFDNNVNALAIYYNGTYKGKYDLSAINTECNAEPIFELSSRYMAFDFTINRRKLEYKVKNVSEQEFGTINKDPYIYYIIKE